MIRYSRPSQKGVGGRWSEYYRIPAEVAPTFARFPAERFPVCGRVEKSRRLYLHDNARIHLDRVKGKGSFLEFEVVATRGAAQARRLMKTLRLAFEIQEDDTIAGSYADMR